MKKPTVELLISVMIALIIAPGATLAGFGLKVPLEEKTEGRAGYFYEIRSGESLTSSITAFSTDDNIQHLVLYGADGRANEDGSISYLSLENENFHIGKWITPLETDMPLGPKETKTIQFKIDIPVDTPPGNYAGAIALSSVSESNNNDGATLQSVIRTIVPIYIMVPGNKVHSFEWPDFSHQYVNNSHRFFLDIENKGNTILNVDLTVEIHNTLNDSSQTAVIEEKSFRIPQGESIKLPVKWEEKPLYGNFQVTATAVFSEFDLLMGKNIGYKMMSKSLNFNVIPWGFLFLAAGILILIFASIFGRISHNKKIIKSCIKYTVQENDTVDLLARKYSADWKQIIKVNKLKPPYPLIPGSILLIPKNNNEKK